MHLITKKLRFIFVICLCVSILCLTGIVAYKGLSAKADEFQFNGTLKAEYSVNDVVTIPTAQIGGVDAEFKVILPDGNYTVDDNLTLRQTGKYVIEYSARVNGELVKDTKSFMVLGNLFTVNGLGYSQYITDEVSGLSGVYFSLLNGDSLTYNDVIDLKTLWTSYKQANHTVIKLTHMPSIIGQADISQYEIILTDAYDSSQSISVRFKHPGYTTHSYLDASFNGGRYCGLNKSNGNVATKYTVEGVTGELSAFLDDKNYGAVISATFTQGTESNPQDASYWGGFKYDYINNVVWGTDYTYGGDYKVVVADFENTSIFGSKFVGFESGLVKLTIKPINFLKGNWGFFINEVGGKAITEKDYSTFVPSHSPKLDLDMQGYGESDVPSVKQGNTYKLFDATAFDLIDGNIPVDVRVFYGFDNVKKIQTPVVDGKFLAEYPGLYTVEYEATNSYGTVSKKVIEIECVGGKENLGINLVGEPNYAVSHDAGEKITVFSQYPTFTNNFGNVKLNVTASRNDDPTIKFDLHAKNGYSFTPLVAGEYTVKFEFSDYSETQIVEKSFEVVSSDLIYYDIHGLFPDYLIQNARYDFSFVTAYALDTGVAVELDTILSTYNKDGELVPVDKLFFADPAFVTDKGTIKFAYYPDGIEGCNILVKEIPVIDAGVNQAGKLDISKMFVEKTGYINFTANTDGIDCTFNSFENGVASFTYANILLVNPLKFDIKPLISDQTFKSFNRLNVYIYDEYDYDNFVKVSYIKKDTGWFATLNDTNEAFLTATWGNKGDSFTLNFNSITNIVMVNNFLNYSGVDFFGTDNKATFNRGARLVLEIEGNKGCDGIKINSLNGIILNNSRDDFSPADIDHSLHNNAGEKELGEIITLNPFYIFDVITPYMESGLTVQFTSVTGQRKIITALDGTELYDVPIDKTYQFKLTEYGRYNVKVSVYDMDNTDNETSYSYNIYVTDYSKLEVTMGTIVKTAKLNDKFTKPIFSVNIDNYGYGFAIKTPDSRMYFVTDNEFVFAKKGVYTITLMVYDKSVNKSDSTYMNTTEVTYTVMVK